ncbi:hypothetical protein PAAG_12115 [Paracoccidioides lutzii Pb01]|uniref:Uncharacterized protein n=1 Tax=Paracoccidioides lutzii (strain ATCC MYA-826 / Pb01) TaxID=502779 RepID=A0A0A2V078_PARBA|nr:hypothetical protein PAAG_12115 [Paracoccidioides lutzii Pb01]KGQ01171.1 hypothetical protein PAAG_12115 [Paracoccidioides lutzii Pb01]
MNHRGATRLVSGIRPGNEHTREVSVVLDVGTVLQLPTEPIKVISLGDEESRLYNNPWRPSFSRTSMDLAAFGD